MRTIPADYNAATEKGHLRLPFQDSQEAMRKFGIEVGDWMWLSDGEVLVGAQLAVDDRYGPVGVPHWDTLVHLDDELGDFESVRKQFFETLHDPYRDAAYWTKLFQLSTILDIMEPPSKESSGAGSYSAYRVAALLEMDEPALALIDLEEELAAKPSDPGVNFYYLEFLKLVNLDRASIEAADRAQREDTPALVLASCINIESMASAQLSDEEFRSSAPRIIGWINRFEFAPDRSSTPPPIWAQVKFDLGMALLRLGRVEQARDAFADAQKIDPSEPAIDEALGLDSFDEQARDIAARLWRKPLAA